MRKVDIVVIALAQPILIGIYEESSLIETYEREEKSSEYIPTIFEVLLEKYDITSITYANGPGSFMAIKMSYLFFKTLEIVKGIKLKAVSAFAFNNNSPIKAMGKLYFHLDDDKIAIRSLEEGVECTTMHLPQTLQTLTYCQENTPNYSVPAV